MQENNYGKRCGFAGKCPVFKGEKASPNGIPLYLYRNVFCNRGPKGWNNCEHYIEYKLDELNKINQNAPEKD